MIREQNSQAQQKFFSVSTTYLLTTINDNRSILQYGQLKIEDEFVLKLLKDLYPKEDDGIDGISSKPLKLIAPAAVSSASKLINFSVR